MDDRTHRHTLGDFWKVWWQPPRPHGEHDGSRSVTFLELFYDLVFVVLVAQAAHTLAHHVTWQGVGEFVIVFGLIWTAWLNGTLYQDLHGRDDGRSRVAIFVQMMIIAPLAVFTPHAANTDSTEFAITYSLLMLVIMLLWWSVRRVDDEQYHSLTAGYIGGQGLAVVIMIGSVLLPEEYRVFAWAAFLFVFVVSTLLMPRSNPDAAALVLRGNHSTTERFGLFTIIVLGEVIVGIVAGMSEAERTGEMLAAGVLGMLLAFGVWWTYFDFVGSRLPADRPHLVIRWTLLHLPVTMSIAALGAGAVSVIEHTGDSPAPAPTAWLVSGSLVLAVMSLAMLYPTLGDFAAHRQQYRNLITVSAAMIPILAVLGAWQPAPITFIAACAAAFVIVWCLMVALWIRGSTAGQLTWPPDVNAFEREHHP
jgi:low temperature requirement protein LtrA